MPKILSFTIFIIFGEICRVTQGNGINSIKCYGIDRDVSEGILKKNEPHFDFDTLWGGKYAYKIKSQFLPLFRILRVVYLVTRVKVLNLFNFQHY